MNSPYATIKLLALILVFCGCSDAEIATPTGTSNLKYSFQALDGSSEIGGVEVFLLREYFTVSDNGVSPHQFTDEYNGCVRINAVFSGTEAIMFTFINWSRVENQLILDLNLSPEPDWSMVIKNEDGGKLEAVMSGRTSDGKQSEHFLEGSAPKADDGKVCVDNANVT
jgi:hypothetical protein